MLILFENYFSYTIRVEILVENSFELLHYIEKCWKHFAPVSQQLFYKGIELFWEADELLI